MWSRVALSYFIANTYWPSVAQMGAIKKTESSLGGLEPPTFRLTAERANRLRHRDTGCPFGQENVNNK